MASIRSMAASMMWVCLFCCALHACLAASISYEDYCKDVLAESDKGRPQHDVPPTSNASNIFVQLGFHGAFFSGGFPLFHSNSTFFTLRKPENFANFRISSAKLAGDREAQKYVVEGSLLMHNRTRFRSAPMLNRTRVFRHAGARWDPFARLGGVRLTVKGLWVAHSGTLCMSGCFMQNGLGQTNPRDDCQVKAVFYYPEKKSISQPLVKGVIESKREQQDPLFFKPVIITGVSEAQYVFGNNLVNAGNWPSQQPNVPESIKIWKDEAAACRFPWYKQQLDVMWDKQCTGQDCSPFEDVMLGSPATLSVENMVCAEGNIYGFFIFHHQETLSQSVSNVFAVEGVWSTSTGQLSASACYLKGAANGSLAINPEDCDIQITLQFPTTLSLVFRYSVVGRVERKKASKFPPFKPFSFTGNMDMTYGSFGWRSSPPQMEYVYTDERITQARTQCQASGPKHSRKGWMGKGKRRYPNGQVFADLGFQATLKDSSGSSATVYLAPVAIDKRTNMVFTRGMGVVTSAATSKRKTKSMNVSFDLNFYINEHDIKLLQNTRSPRRFPAEGVYNRKTGMLCLIACRPLTLSKAQVGSKLYDDAKDCEMLVTIQYPPINPGYFEKHVATGKVTSLREQKDPLFFTPATLSSAPFFYQEQASNSLIQIDFEIIMGMISLTMAVLFIGLQLRHVKKNPKVLSQTSLLMLTVLILGHLIPLVLNFEGIFSSRSRQNVLQWSGGWLEINEVIVRLMTMLVVLMLIRLFYLSWVSKAEVSSSEGPWHMERGSLRVCLTLYALGGLLALIVYGIKGSNFLDVTKGFAGLTVDFFLVPQVVGNYAWEIQGSVLSWPFYIGMTLVRSLPHLYDILRKLEFFSLDNRRYYYANPSWDFYSSAWDAIIPIGNVLLAVLICLQQRYGGACLSIGPWRRSRPYIQVSMNPI